MNSDIQEGKLQLPLPKLMQELGYGDRAKESAHCPFHLPDRNPSFGIFQNDGGRWIWKCQAGCGHGDEIDFLAKAKGIDVKEATKEFLRMAGVERKAKPATSSAPASAPQQAAVTAEPVKPRPLAELLGAVRDTLRRYVSFQFMEQPTAVALWVLHTWAFEAFYFTPYLHVFSAETSSGKSRLLEVLALLVNKPWKLDSGSVATIFRKIDTEKPTVLYDEIDNVFRGNGKDDDTKDLRACLNSGFKWDGKFSRCVGQHANLEVKEFATFAPKALAGIGKVLSDTLSNRCIEIELKRRTRAEKVERFREREAQAALAGLRAELEAWAQQPGVIDALKAARPALPDELTDRQQDICEPLLAIADMAGEGWPGQARAALLRLFKQGGDTVSIGVQLLADIKQIFDEAGTDKLATIYILDELVKIEDDRPWATWWLDDLKHEKSQKPATRLAKLLKPYGIKSHKVRIGDNALQGYDRQDCEEAWSRYLPEAGTSGTSGTYEGKNVPACDSAPALMEQGGTRFHEGKMQNVPDVPDVPAFPGPAAEGEAHGHLAALLGVLDRDAADGLWPRGHADCQWGQEYPHEYSMAQGCLESGGKDSQEAFRRLDRLVFKIESEAKRGVPLSANGHDWSEGSYPQAFLDARAYVREQWAKVEQIALAA